MKARETQVLVFGSFDLLHQGHLHFLQQCYQVGKEISVVLASDAEILQYKHRFAADDFAVRKAALLQSGLVSFVFSADQQHGEFQVLQNLTVLPDLIVLGHDQVDLAHALYCFFASFPAYRCEIMWAKAYKRNFFNSTRFHEYRLGT